MTKSDCQRFACISGVRTRKAAERIKNEVFQTTTKASKRQEAVVEYDKQKYNNG